MYNHVVYLSRKLYPAQVVLKAAYSFLNIAYIHIDESNDQWVIEISLKPTVDIDLPICEEFGNEIISQVVRLMVYEKTHGIREMLMARAMSSSMITMDASPEISKNGYDISEQELAQILSNWFDEHE